MEEVEQSDTEEDRIYEYLLDSGALNDVHAVAESIASSSTTDWSADGSESEDARRIADRLLEQNAEDVDRALEAIVRDARLATDVRLVDGRWTELLDIGPGRTPRQTLRNLDALARLPFAYDTYAGQYFRKLTKGLEHAYAVDAFFVPAGRVYAKLVDVAPDPDCATESFGSLCEATHLRCLRPDLSKSVAAVCLLIRCMATICVRCAGSKSVRSAVTEFVATVIRANALHRPTGRSQDHPPRSDMTSPYAILYCADPTARWFDRVSRYHSCRSAFFDCLDGDRNLLKIVVSGFFHWMTEPIIPSKSDKNSATTVIRYISENYLVYAIAGSQEGKSTRNRH
ncbi:Hypothetical protein CINCED_3A008871 [Cinara cedri]|uniref:Uncharacterized protein n=1 Tax=Cinara cedri TaxID=506608 RepID=A0A5E4M503_9HEMI|nr:Hypothetical protein CINCED_3A008871 [Cinara cedri]